MFNASPLFAPKRRSPAPLVLWGHALVLAGRNVLCWGEERTLTTELRTRCRTRNFELFFVHVCRHIGKKRRAQIAFASVGSMQRMFAPFSASAATWSAPAK